MRAKEFIFEAADFTAIDVGFDSDRQMKYSDDQYQIIANIIKKNCGPYIEANRAALENKVYLYRGIMNADAFKFAIEGNVRQDRRARDTPAKWHEMFNQYFTEAFGFPYRSAAMFAALDYVEASNYGDTYIVFPAGSYRICYSPMVRDISCDLTSIGAMSAVRSVVSGMSLGDIEDLAATYGFAWETHRDIMDEFSTRSSMSLQLPQGFVDFLTEYFLPRLEYTVTKQISDIGTSEAMVRCDKYYGIRRAGTYRSDGQYGANTIMKMILA